MPDSRASRSGRSGSRILTLAIGPPDRHGATRASLRGHLLVVASAGHQRQRSRPSRAASPGRVVPTPTMKGRTDLASRSALDECELLVLGNSRALPASRSDWPRRILRMSRGSDRTDSVSSSPSRSSMLRTTAAGRSVLSDDDPSILALEALHDLGQMVLHVGQGHVLSCRRHRHNSSHKCSAVNRRQRELPHSEEASSRRQAVSPNAQPRGNSGGEPLAWPEWSDCVGQGLGRAHDVREVEQDGIPVAGWIDAQERRLGRLACGGARELTALGSQGGCRITGGHEYDRAWASEEWGVIGYPIGGMTDLMVIPVQRRHAWIAEENAGFRAVVSEDQRGISMPPGARSGRQIQRQR